MGKEDIKANQNKTILLASDSSHGITIVVVCLTT